MVHVLPHHGREGNHGITGDDESILPTLGYPSSASSGDEHDDPSVQSTSQHYCVEDDHRSCSLGDPIPETSSRRDHRCFDCCCGCGCGADLSRWSSRRRRRTDGGCSCNYHCCCGCCSEHGRSPARLVHADDCRRSGVLLELPDDGKHLGSTHMNHGRRTSSSASSAVFLLSSIHPSIRPSMHPDMPRQNNPAGKRKKNCIPFVIPECYPSFPLPSLPSSPSLALISRSSLRCPFLPSFTSALLFFFPSVISVHIFPPFPPFSSHDALYSSSPFLENPIYFFFPLHGSFSLFPSIDFLCFTVGPASQPKEIPL